MCLFSEDIHWFVWAYVVVAVYHTLQEIVTQCQNAQKKNFHLTKIIFVIVKLIYDRISLAI